MAIIKLMAKKKASKLEAFFLIENRITKIISLVYHLLHPSEILDHKNLLWGSHFFSLLTERMSIKNASNYRGILFRIIS